MNNPHNEEMTDLHDIEKQLAEAQRLYDSGEYDSACRAASLVLATLEREQREVTVEYSEAMRIFGMASYRSGDIVMADNALTFAYNTRAEIGRCDDDTTKELLLTLSEVTILRDDHVRTSEILERLSEISK